LRRGPQSGLIRPNLAPPTAIFDQGQAER
jgi:hypothetical protein